MSDRKTALLRFAVLGMAGYFSLATIPPSTGSSESAHVDVLLDAEPQTVRLRITLDAMSVTILAPEALSIVSSTAHTWSPGEGPASDAQYCTSSHGPDAFCEDVPSGSATLDYELLLSGTPGQQARIEVIAASSAPSEPPDAQLGVSIEVLP